MGGVTDIEGVLWKSYRYSPTGDITFGKPQYNNVYSYNAEDYNPNLKVQYLRARFYDVERGDFLTEDGYLGDITDPLTLNRYNYVKSSALNYIDPSGHMEISIPDIIKEENLIQKYYNQKDKQEEKKNSTAPKRNGLGYTPEEDWNRIIEGEREAERRRQAAACIPKDVLSLMNAPIDSTWGIPDSVAEAWFLSTDTAVIKKYGLNSTNIGEVTAAIWAAGVSPVFFYAYTVNEGGGLGGFINHHGRDYYAKNGGDTAVNAASGDAQYLADLSKNMDFRPAWVDVGVEPHLRIDFVPQSVKDSGNASFDSMPSGSIGRAYIPSTAAATWEVYYPDGLSKSYNQVQDYGAPMKGVLSFIETMSKY